MADQPALACPACRQQLALGDDRHDCDGCGRSYPVVAGIPDLRLRSDRYLDLEAERDKAQRLAAAEELSFADLVRAYWRMTPEVPPALADRFAANVLRGVERAQVHLDELGLDLSGRRLLDVGCGTGGLLVAAARRGAVATGADLALRWLVVAARHLRDEGVEASLVAADGAALPFAPSSFDVVTCVETVEHAEDQDGLVRSLLEAPAAGGACYVVTANRFTLAPEPTVRLWGLGFLPRRYAHAYVRRRRGAGYRFVRPLSRAELMRMVRHDGTAVVAPAPLPAPGPGAAAPRRLAQQVYERLRRPRAVRPLLATITPYLQLTSRKRP